MKLLFIANERVPSEKANSINIVKMCSSFASAGQDVTLVIPSRKNSLGVGNDLFNYYQVSKDFSIHTIPVPETLDFGKYGFLWNQFIFSLKIFFHKQWNPKEYIVFTRDIYTSLFLSWRGYTVFHDLHGFPESSHWFWKYVLKKMEGIICTNIWKMNQLAEKYDISKEKMIVAPNGFDDALFFNLHDQNQVSLRKKFDLPTEKPIALYSGHFYDWKGAHILAQAAKWIPQVQVVIMGGSDSEVESFTKKYGMCHNITILGHKPYTQVPEYLYCADALILPNSLQSVNPRLVMYSQYDTSPIKMFEYMASGRPIVGSNLPSIREVLDETNAIFFETDNPQDLAEKIQWTLDHSEQAKILAEKAKQNVQEFSWKKRAGKILDFMNKQLTINK